MSCWIAFAGSILSPPLSTNPLAAGRFLCCVPLDCLQMLVDEWKLCLSFPIHRFHLQSQGCKLVRKKKKQMFICWILYDYHSILKIPLHSSVLTFLAVCASEPWRTSATKSFISVSSLTSAIVETGNSAAWILIKKKMTAYYKYPWLVITYSQRNTVLLERWLLNAFWSSED